PDLKIKTISINEILGLGPTGGKWPDDADQKMTAAADVISLSPGYQGWSEKKLIRDLKPFIDNDASFRPDDFLPNTLAQYQWQGGTWGVPTSAEYQFIVYDKDAFDRAGVKYPEPGWTWADFAATAKALTLRDGDTVKQWGLVQTVPQPMLFIGPRVPALMDKSTDPATPLFDKPEVKAAVQWYVDLHLIDKSTPYFEMTGKVSVANLPEGYKLVQAGKAAMWVDSGVSWQIRKQQKATFGIVPLPVDAAGSRTSPVYPSGVVMSSGSAQPAAAWRWMNYLSQQPPKGYGTLFTQMSARRSVLASSGYLDKVDKELAAALRFAIDHTATFDMQADTTALTDGIESILKGEKSIEAALADAQTKAKTDLAEAARKRADATPVPTVAVAAPKATPVNQAATTIKFSIGTGLFNVQAYRDLAKRFTGAHPDIAVEIKQADFSNVALDIPDVAKDVDCFMWAPSLQDPKNLEAILNLEPFLDADKSFDKADFYPATIEQFTEQGQLWALPAEVTPYVIEYNKDLFDAAKVAYPKSGWTTEDFLATAKALTKGADTDRQYGFVGDYYESTDVILMLQQLGAKLIDTSVTPPAVIFDDATMRKAMQWYADLHSKHDVKPAFITDFAELLSKAASALSEREGLIDNGRAAMWTTYAGAPNLTGSDRSKMNIGVVALPIGAAGPASGNYISSNGYYISADTPARQACWQWMTYLTSEAGVIKGVPARKSVAESEAYRQQVGPERAAAYLASFGGGTSSVYQFFSGKNSWLSYSIFWLSKAYGQVVDGTAPVDKALADAQKLADDFRACVVQNKAEANSERQRKCVKQVDPSIPDFLLGLSQ
ncbi:MAG: extracellular solute-binding protein, partial [Chloroflexi bacterium]|nr:extracellular solute-binding protein [Chloroflexota bacterium]